MSIWDEHDLEYLLNLFDITEIKSINELSALIFLTNYYGMIDHGKTFFSYKFVKSGNSIKAKGLAEDLKEMILCNLIIYRIKGDYVLTDLGKSIMNKYSVNKDLLISLISEFSPNPAKKIDDFIFIRKTKDHQEIII